MEEEATGESGRVGGGVAEESGKVGGGVTGDSGKVGGRAAGDSDSIEGGEAGNSGSVGDGSENSDKRKILRGISSALVGKASLVSHSMSTWMISSSLT